MKPILFRGSGVALATPFTLDGLDEPRLRERVCRQIEQGTDAIILCGTTGEPNTMPLEERDRAVSIALDAANGRAPIIVGTGSNSTATAIKLSRHAEQLGAAGLLVVTPYYNRPNQRGLIEHFLAIADSTSIPLILYNVPNRTGVNLLPESAARLAEHRRIIALKESGTDLAQLMQTIALAGPNLGIYAGNDDLIFPVMALGGLGAISVAANIIPTEIKAITHSYLSGDMDESRTEQLRWLPLIRLLFAEPNPQPLKCAMAMLGLDSGYLRPPLHQVDTQTKAVITAELMRMGVMPAS